MKALSVWALLAGTAVYLGAADARPPKDYYPFAIGTKWVYQVSKGAGTTKRMTVRVSDRQAGKDGVTYQLSVTDLSLPPAERPDEPLEFRVQPDGNIYCEKCPGYLIKSPLTQGAAWESTTGDQPEQSRVLSADQAVKVGSKTYEHCVVIETVNPAAHQRLVTSYAPEVGPVLAEYFEGTRKVRREELTAVPPVVRSSK